MKLVFTKSNLNKAVNIVSKAVPSKTTMPILECILIDAETNDIKFTANDMELGIETKIEGQILEKGKVAINAKIFSDIVRKLPDDDITIETDANFTATISSCKSVFHLTGQSGEDFSYLPAIERDKKISLSQFSMKELINQTIFSTAMNDNNKMMTGELFEVQENALRVVALDGHRIAIRKVNLSEEAQAVKAIVPGKTLVEIQKILSNDAESTLTLYFTQNHILFEFENTKVVSRLIEGEYFKINNMLSSDYETKVTVNKKAFLDSIDRSTLMIKEGDKKPIIVDIKEDDLCISVKSEIGNMKENVAITKEGKDIMIGFNPKFLIDALRAIDDENVDMYMVSPKAPLFIRDKEENYIYLILPVNFSN